MSELLRDVETPSDAELISRVRGGDVAAYGELFSRHKDAATRLARQLVRGPDSDDLVAEAFAKMLTVLQGGGGPDVAFRAYLLTAVRRLHIDRIRQAQRLQTTDDLTPFDPGVPFQDTAVAGFENGAAARAFASLPERWQLVLWHLEVEGQKPADIAPLLGMSPNSVSALAYRAREGLRQAFLTMHLTDIPDADCRWVNEHLSAYVRKGLSKRDVVKVESHLETCRRCTALYVELHEVNSNLAGILGPLLLGSAAAGYLAGGTGAGTAGAVSIVSRAREVVVAHTGGTAVAGAAATVAAATVAIAVAGGLGGLGGGPRSTVVADPPAAVTSFAAPVPSGATASTSSPGAAGGSGAARPSTAPTPRVSPRAVPATGTTGTTASAGPGPVSEPVPDALSAPPTAGPVTGPSTGPTTGPVPSAGPTGPGASPTSTFTSEPGGVTSPPVTEPPPTPDLVVLDPVLHADGSVTVSVRNLRAGDTVDVGIASSETTFDPSAAVPGCSVVDPGRVTCRPQAGAPGAPATGVLDFSATLPLAFPPHMVSDEVDVTVEVDGTGSTTRRQSFRPARIPTFDVGAPVLTAVAGGHSVTGDRDAYTVASTAHLPPRVTGLVYRLDGPDGVRLTAATWRSPARPAQDCDVADDGRALTCPGVRDEDEVRLSLAAESLRGVATTTVRADPVDTFTDPTPGDAAVLRLAPGADLGVEVAVESANPDRDARVTLAGRLTGLRPGVGSVTYTLGPGATWPRGGNPGCEPDRPAPDSLTCPAPAPGSGAVRLTVLSAHRSTPTPLTVSVAPTAPFEAVGSGPHSADVVLPGRPVHDYSFSALTATGHRLVRVAGDEVDRYTLTGRVGTLPAGAPGVAFALTDGGSFATDQPDHRCRLSTAPDTGGQVLCVLGSGERDVDLAVDSTSTAAHDATVELVPAEPYDDTDDTGDGAGSDLVSTVSDLRPGTQLVLQPADGGPLHAGPDGDVPVTVTLSGVRRGVPGVTLVVSDGLTVTGSRTDGCTVTDAGLACSGVADGDRVGLTLRAGTPAATTGATLRVTPGGDFVELGGRSSADLVLVPHLELSLAEVALTGHALDGDADEYTLRTRAASGSALPAGAAALGLRLTGGDTFSARQPDGCERTGAVIVRCAGLATGDDVAVRVRSTRTQEHSATLTLLAPDGYDDLDPADNTRTVAALRPGVDLRLSALDPDNESPANDDDRHLVATRLAGVRPGLAEVAYRLRGDAALTGVSADRCSVTDTRTVTCADPQDGPVVLTVTADDVRSPTPVSIAVEPAGGFVELDGSDNAAATRLAPRPTYDFGIDSLVTSARTVADGADQLTLTARLRALPPGLDAVTLAVSGATFAERQDRQAACDRVDATHVRCADLDADRSADLRVTSVAADTHRVEVSVDLPRRYDDPDAADNTAAVTVVPAVDLRLGPLTPADPVPTNGTYTVGGLVSGVRSGPVVLVLSGAATFVDSSCEQTTLRRVTCAGLADGDAVRLTLRPDRPATRSTVTVHAGTTRFEELDETDNSAPVSLAPDLVMESVRAVRTHRGSFQTLVRAQVAGVPAGLDVLRLRLTGGSVGPGPGQVHLVDGESGADGEDSVDCYTSDAAGRHVTVGDYATCTGGGSAPAGRFYVDLRVAHPRNAGTVTVSVAGVGADEGPHVANNARGLALG